MLFEVLQICSFLQNPGSGSSTPGSTPTAAAAAAAAAASAWRWISPPTGGGGGAAGSCQQQQQQTAGSQYSQQQAAAVAAVNQALSYAQVLQGLLLVLPFGRKIGRVIQKRPNKNVCSRIKCGVAGGKSVRPRTSSTYSSKEQRRPASFEILCFFMWIYQFCGSVSGIRCLFDPLDPGSWISDPYFESLVTIVWVKISIILWKLAQIFFFSISKINNFQFCEIYGYIKRYDN